MITIVLRLLDFMTEYHNINAMDTDGNTQLHLLGSNQYCSDFSPTTINHQSIERSIGYHQTLNFDIYDLITVVKLLKHYIIVIPDGKPYAFLMKTKKSFMFMVKTLGRLNHYNITIVIRRKKWKLFSILKGIPFVKDAAKKKIDSYKWLVLYYYFFVLEPEAARCCLVWRNRIELD
jgi:hypothetical protein